MQSAAERRKLIDDAMSTQPANDQRPARQRLFDYALRGISSPETLSLPEVKELAFALSLYITLDERE